MRLYYFAGYDLESCKGGCKLHVEGITTGLAKLGWDVTLFSAAENIKSQQPNYPFKCVLTQRKRVSIIHQLWYQLKIAFKLFFCIKDRPDVVYIRSNFMAFPPIFYARFFKIPFFYEINGIQSNETSRQHLVMIAENIENWFLKKVTGIFCVTDELREYFMNRTGLPADRFYVVHNGVDADLWPEGGVQREREDTLNIGFLGHFQARQGLETIFQAIPKISKEIDNLRFIIGGTGLEEERYKQHVKDLGLEDRVEFVGFVNKKDIPAFLAKSDVTVAPYTLEFAKGGTGLSPIKIFTYLACERIVVASALSGLSDFKKCSAVRFAIPDDPDDFAQKIVEVLKMTCQEREILGKQAGQFILDGYTWDHVAQKTTEKIKLWCKVLRK